MGWSAPEQLAGDAAVGATADVYAVSAIVVSAVSGTSHPAVVDHPANRPFVDAAFDAGVAAEPSGPGSSPGAGPVPVAVGGRGRGVSRVMLAAGLGAVAVISAAVWAVWAVWPEPASTIAGPTEIVAGELERYTVADPDATGVRWFYLGAATTAATLDVRGAGPGEIGLDVTYRDGSGDERADSLTITVQPSPLGPTITGPDRVAVGDTVEYTVAVGIADAELRWLYDGRRFPVDAAHPVTATAPGSVELVVVQTDPSGSELRAVKAIEVVRP